MNLVALPSGLIATHVKAFRQRSATRKHAIGFASAFATSASKTKSGGSMESPPGSGAARTRTMRDLPYAPPRVRSVIPNSITPNYTPVCKGNYRLFSVFCSLLYTPYTPREIISYGEGKNGRKPPFLNMRIVQFSKFGRGVCKAALAGS